MRILFATNNPNKVREAKEIFRDLGLDDIEIMTPKDVGMSADIYEDGNSFEENSYIKANYFYEKFGFITMADDSGLCVDALNGEPGIYSSRYSGGDEDDNIDLLLQKMDGEMNRNAHFHCDLCVIKEDTVLHFVGVCDGYIRQSRSGDNGFGYDPIFDVNYDGIRMSFASIPEKDKNRMSHRFKAIYKFACFLKETNLLN